MSEGVSILVADGRSISLVRGDITRETACAIVNAANARLAAGGGVCGAIRTAAGAEPFAEAAQIVRERGPLTPGDAVATSGGRLEVRYIIHAVGPVWHGGDRGEADDLASCYRESMRVADELGCSTIAFPSISTGIFGYPPAEAAPVALAAIREELENAEHVREVRVVLYDVATAAAWEVAAR